MIVKSRGREVLGLYEGRLFARILRDPAGEPVHGQPRYLLATEPLMMEAFT
ncbi:hypothetical protein FTUN_4250 [Frigoriglobus tundricola]|uniref:Uncharacterized protein n=1 Tax=Frigoriglobus tundricola TaxID=2774151 RepID=A0A6M5YTW2_9BACT|nr:hypothetical protein FTUN_4250 [Frigoriglobus tundricola]